MRDIHPSPTPKLMIFETQPDFPDKDLTETNAAYLAHILTNDESERAHAAAFETNLVPLFRLGHEALQMCELPSEDSRVSYDAFCDGFAASEFAMRYVNAQPYNGTRAVAATHELIRSGVTASIELSDQYLDWLESHTNTFGMVADVSTARHDTIKQTQARAIGACTAIILQRGSLFVL